MIYSDYSIQELDYTNPSVAHYANAPHTINKNSFSIDDYIQKQLSKKRVKNSLSDTYTAIYKHLNDAIIKQTDQMNQFFDLSKFTGRLKQISARVSSARCARSIRTALENAGAHIDQHPVAASDWGRTLEKIGYKKIDPAFDQPIEGDIYIIQRTKRHTYGHIAGYTGTQWVSDYKQPSYDVYHDPEATYVYYRLSSS
ncbi:CHAP domain-containing protein [Acinetobacter rathckeae]|uniref:CHAP domain-containing protein n=1 Tax=Acinetobacter rathckeae TaxID=2605272 RepID=UPI0018A319BF|nr:CHAP domain-containing protein [Acinetobacter rathckeae]MBF7689003.1 CHAP domain-containing protein [Acinetobacter rathckeae]MBF7696523.1 CHAP domain-containing protein [Acinetobacter rathckeae]